jgi:hypothetical protein
MATWLVVVGLSASLAVSGRFERTSLERCTECWSFDDPFLTSEISFGKLKGNLSVKDFYILGTHVMIFAENWRFVLNTKQNSAKKSPKTVENWRKLGS